MDSSRFDQLTRLVSGAGGRRTLLRAVLGAVFGLPVVEAPASKRGLGNGKRQGGRHGLHRDRLSAERHGKKGRKKKHRGGSGGEPPSASCCGGKSCATPKAGSLRDDCDYAGEDFFGADLRGAQFERIDGRESRFIGADLRGAHFGAACLQGAAFRRAKLAGALFGEACLFGADFTGAELGGASAVFNGALFCGTTMPDGRVNDRDCGDPTVCCQQAQPGPSCQSASDCTDQECKAKACQNGSCVYTAVADGPDPSGQCAHCCEGVCCLSPANTCNPSGFCCAPNCAGRQCGPNGCGGSGTCGACPQGQVCNQPSGQCACTATSCPGGLVCCGGVCRQATGSACTQDGACCPNDKCVDGHCQCVPDCTGKVCGPDGCGGRCGSCPGDIICCTPGIVCCDVIGGAGACCGDSCCTTVCCPSTHGANGTTCCPNGCSNDPNNPCL